MPFCYGGGISNISQAERLRSMGLRKIALNSHLLSQPSFISDCAIRFGNQSVVAVIDVKIEGKKSMYSLKEVKNAKLLIYWN